MNAEIVAMLLAGGRGTRLNLIAAKRAKPAVPFAGTYRIIDFTLTNAMESGIRHVGVLTQYRPTSLMGHLGDGDAWDLHGRNACLTILPPSLGRDEGDWYRGTADAIYQNLAFIRSLKPRYVMILSGDHIYHMDYRPMLAQHKALGSHLTIAAMEVPWEECFRFGVMVCDAHGRVQRFVEKSRDRVSNLANMGLYIFDTDVLVDELQRTVPGGGYDFGANVIPSLLGRRDVHAHRFEGYWRDVGTLGSFWSANMDALDPRSGLDLPGWRTRTNLEGRGQAAASPARVGSRAKAQRSIVSRGCEVDGEVVGSVLSPGVRIGRGARVVDSVLMHDCVVGPGAVVARAILDKDVTVGAGARVGREDARDGENREFPTHLSDGITVVGKGTRIPDGATVGANVLVGTHVPQERFPAALADGESLL